MGDKLLMNDINDQDKLIAAISYPIGILAIIVLLVEDMRNRPYQKYHAVQALAVNLVILVIDMFLFWTICIPFLLIIPLIYWAIKAYQGEYFEIPGLTGFLKGQGWI
jgi:uncharacterized membrane protein